MYTVFHINKNITLCPFMEHKVIFKLCFYYILNHTTHETITRVRFWGVVVMLPFDKR